MKFRSSLLLAIVLGAAMLSCSSKKTYKSTMHNLIPKPVSANETNEVFTLSDSTAIYVQSDSPADLQVAQWFADKIKPATGFALKVSASKEAPKAGGIYLIYGTDSTLGDEGYELNISKDMVRITANTPAGWFYALQTIRQLLPPDAELGTTQKGPWQIAAGTIRDYPEYTYRGSMLDVARHFFSVEDVKRYIDLIAAYKMNILHLHLSDDQGWRIEIKSWPNLTSIGGSTEVGGGKGGFYTQEQYKDIVKYAQDRFVTIIPEIDMPGHTNAALASYPELHSIDSSVANLQKNMEQHKETDTAINLYTGTEVGFSTLRTHKEITYKFIDDVIRELAAITPGPWIHIGGDESHVTSKEDYIPFVTKVQQMVVAHGKKVIGWDEIALSTTMQPNSAVQFWADADNSKLAVSKGAKVIMSPAKKAYLDMQYDSTTRLGLHWAAYIEVDSAYMWDPANYADSIRRENILGVEGALWSETITKMDDIEYMVFPRLPGLAELAWSPAAGRSWDEYKVRLGNQAPRFKAMGIDYYPSKLVPWKE
ncbi:MAG TPA: beta-N-acetylhexosaminidase [Panacibacter sp.]|nr:beta-N-acetylhexosaminidase [Panacibacter sp.]HNP42873.1 beta-N-acetylhexosaminidase [Panacibacter sp.]